VSGVNAPVHCPAKQIPTNATVSGVCGRNQLDLFFTLSVGSVVRWAAWSLHLDCRLFLIAVHPSLGGYCAAMAGGVHAQLREGFIHVEGKRIINVAYIFVGGPLEKKQTEVGGLLSIFSRF